MSRITQRISLSICGLILTVGVVAGQPAAQLPTATAQTFSLEDCKKIYGHLTLNQMMGWYKRDITIAVNVQQMERDIAEAMNLFNEANKYFTDGHPDKGKETMGKCLAILQQNFSEDFPAFGDMVGTYGVMLSQAGDVAGADEAFRKQRACMDKVFPASQFPDGHSRIATTLATIGTGQYALGRREEGEKLLREALQMYRKKGPVIPNGSDLTFVIVQLSVVLASRKEYGEAESLAREALKRCQSHCETPDGLTAYGQLLAKAKHNLGSILQAQGKIEEAERLLAEAAVVNNGDLSRAQRGLTLANQATLAIGKGDFPKALALSDEALRLVEAEYPATEYPRGHPNMVQTLLVRGEAFAATGNRDAAEREFARCLQMVREIYPDDRCPDGHPELATILLGIGSLHLRHPTAYDQRAAARYFRDSLTISLGHTRAYAAHLSEAEMLQQLGSGAGAADGLLSVTTPFDSRDYWYLWETKAAVMRLLDHRRRLAVRSTDPAVREILRQLAEVQGELAAKSLAPATLPGAATISSELTPKKEELERRLAVAQGLPPLPRTGPGPIALAQVLSPTAAFIDFWMYRRIEQDPTNASNSGRQISLHYAAFVLTRDGEMARVELGPVSRIDAAVHAWLFAITQDPPDPIRERDAAGKVATLVWKPLRAVLPSSLTAVYVCPDGVFGRLPFAALPDNSGNKVLLEELKIVEVPHGPGLLAWLKAQPLITLKGPVLAVGDVDYGREPGPGPGLKPLPGTQKEIRAVELAAQDRVDPVHKLTGANSTAGEVLAKLATARVAHFATHASANGAGLAPATVSGIAFNRNPFIGCRLALSGANTGSPGSSLVGEIIARQNLDNLDLTVLSACESAIGTSVSGEGVYALRRAFHTAGCRAVVASQWPVGDISTAALMSRFYHHLWVERKPPDDALRAAQLDLYRDPTQIPLWAEGKRGDAGTPRIGGVIPLPPPPSVIRESLPAKWAGFQLSINHY